MLTRLAPALLVASVSLCSVMAVGAPPPSSSAVGPAGDDATGSPAEGAAASAAAKARHARTAPYRAAIKAAMAADPRTNPLMADLRAAFKLRDQAKRAEALRALNPRVVALRKDILTKANLSSAQLDALKNSDFTDGLAERLPKPQSSNELGSVTVTSFPEHYKGRSGCPDAGDTWNFEPDKKVIVQAVSTPVDDDCDGLRAGRRTGQIPIPAGAKRARVTMTGHVDLYVAAASVGVYAYASSEFGVRVHLPQGSYGTAWNPATQKTEPLRWKRVRSHFIRAKHEGPEGLLYPVDITTYEENLQPGDDKATVDITLPTNPGPSMSLSPYVSGMVDADFSGIAELDSDIAIQSLKVTFYKE